MQSNFVRRWLGNANVQCEPGIWGQMYLHNHSKPAAPRAWLRSPINNAKKKKQKNNAFSAKRAMRECSISMTTKGLCMFLADLWFLTKEANFGSLSRFYTANTVLQLILLISLHFGEKTSGIGGVNTAMYDFLVFFSHGPTRLLDHFCADLINNRIFTETGFWMLKKV